MFAQRRNTPMKAIKITWETLTDSLSIVGKYRCSSLYPLLSYSVLVLITFTAIIPLFERVLGSDQQNMLTRVLLCLSIYLAYGVLHFVITFCNVALLTGISARLDGGDPDLGAGMLRAAQRIGQVASYTLVSATLGLLSFLARVVLNPIVGKVILPLIGKRLWVRWRQLSYSIPLLMAVPVIALDHPAPAHVFKRAGRLVKATWGERVKPAHSVELLALLVLLPILILVATPTLRQGAAEHNADLIRLGLSVLLIAISTYTQLSALVNAIFALAAYRYATVRKSDVVPGDPSYAEHAFVKPTKETDAGAALADSTSDSASY
jgi:hypothetical protein